MNSTQLQEHLDHLQLSQSDAAALLLVTPRTVRRWQKDDLPVPDAVAQRLQAWRELSDAKLPWTAGIRALWQADVDDQVRRHSEHDVALASLLKRVAARGGPTTSWQVNLDKGTASLGPITVSFYLLQSEGFSPAHYRRSDDLGSDAERDGHLIEDAIAAFAAAVSDARRARPGHYWNGKEIANKYAARAFPGVRSHA